MKIENDKGVGITFLYFLEISIKKGKEKDQLFWRVKEGWIVSMG